MNSRSARSCPAGRGRLRLLLLVGALLALLGTPVPATTAQAEEATRVAIIVGPVGEELTPIYIQLAELAAARAEAAGATVARAYSPEATPHRVVAAVEDASIVVYFGHGTGFPNPYSDTRKPAVVNGWALQGPAADGTNADTLRDGRMRYYGEAWLEANLHPAPGFVMIYSNACYAPGASEGGLPAPDEAEARQHVANYARPAFALGASAYYATDFYGGAATLLASLMDGSRRTYGEVFAADAHYDVDAVRVVEDDVLAGQQIWLHRSRYFEGKLDYWYAFAGDPDVVFDGTGSLLASAGGRAVRGIASSYAFTTGMEGVPTVALPDALGGKATLSINGWVAVCADRCAILPIVDSCPCYWGTPDQRVVNLSHSAWALLSDAPLEEGLIPVRLYLDGEVPPGEQETPLILTTSAQEPLPPAAPLPGDRVD